MQKNIKEKIEDDATEVMQLEKEEQLLDLQNSMTKLKARIANKQQYSAMREVSVFISSVSSLADEATLHTHTH